MFNLQLTKRKKNCKQSHDARINCSWPINVTSLSQTMCAADVSNLWTSSLSESSKVNIYLGSSESVHSSHSGSKPEPGRRFGPGVCLQLPLHALNCSSWQLKFFLTSSSLSKALSWQPHIFVLRSSCSFNRSQSSRLFF